jgi:hypothetical protein
MDRFKELPSDYSIDIYLFKKFQAYHTIRILAPVLMANCSLNNFTLEENRSLASFLAMMHISWFIMINKGNQM